MTDRRSGLPIDNLRFRRPSVALHDAIIGDYTNITNIGLQLIAVAAAHAAGLVADGGGDPARTDAHHSGASGDLEVLLQLL